MLPGAAGRGALSAHTGYGDASFSSWKRSLKGTWSPLMSLQVVQQLSCGSWMNSSHYWGHFCLQLMHFTVFAAHHPELTAKFPNNPISGGLSGPGGLGWDMRDAISRLVFSPSQNQPGSRFSLCESCPERIPSARVHHHILKQHGTWAAPEIHNLSKFCWFFTYSIVWNYITIRKAQPKICWDNLILNSSMSFIQSFCGF